MLVVRAGDIEADVRDLTDPQRLHDGIGQSRNLSAAPLDGNCVGARSIRCDGNIDNLDSDDRAALVDIDDYVGTVVIADVEVPGGQLKVDRPTVTSTWTRPGG